MIWDALYRNILNKTRRCLEQLPNISELLTVSWKPVLSGEIKPYSVVYCKYLKYAGFVASLSIYWFSNRFNISLYKCRLNSLNWSFIHCIFTFALLLLQFRSNYHLYNKALCSYILAIAGQTVEPNWLAFF